MRKHLVRAALVFGAGASLALGPGEAFAAEGPAGAPTGHDLAVLSGVVGGKGTLDRLATTKFPGAAAVSAEAAARTAQADVTKPVGVYEPTAEFIAGKSAVPAALSYVAMPARTGDGSVATVWAQREAGTWSVFNVASGDVENRFASAAGKGYLVHEPQVNAWYSVEGGTVTVLDGSVTGVATGTRMTVDAYRAALRDRYADKLPGSAYDRSGAGGGYSKAVAAKPAAAEPESSTVSFVLGGAALALLGAGSVVAIRVRRN
ncbi:hypothetical protein [Amycolatopsis minnesotensis]